MAVRRVVSTSFWNDSKVDSFTPEDKYFMLYLLTNPHTTQLGIYEFSKKHAAFELGYSIESVSALLERFEYQYGIIKCSQETNEIAIKNYLKHSIIKGGKPVLDCLQKDANQVKDESLLKYICNSNKHSSNATVAEFIDFVKEKYAKESNASDNDNDNERIVNESYHESSNEGENKLSFEDFWKAYPKKKSKGSAEKAWKKIKPNQQLISKIIKAVETMKTKEQWTKENGQFIPYPATWLNAMGWEDEDAQPEKKYITTYRLPEGDKGTVMDNIFRDSIIMDVKEV